MEMKILGEMDIPTNRVRGQDNVAKEARSILEQLNPGKALALEFGSEKEAKDMRSMLYTMSILKYTESGRIKTKIIENLMYVWLTN